jgi:OsmC-like protein
VSAVSDHVFAVRARRAGAGAARVYARNHTFAVGAQVSLRDQDDHPSAVEMLLGALAGDLLAGFEAQAARGQVAVHEAELNVTGRLDNVLVHLGVIGETGHPGLASITGAFYVSADAEERVLGDLWRATLDRSPLYHTLSRCAAVSIRLQPSP